MSNLVIVAIPAEDDRVWKISSEKVPHLTLLFLGEETGDVARLDRITQFVEHAVNVAEHGDFMLEVDHRGTLGVDEADVLHFRKNYSFKWIEFLRNQLLQQPDIRTAYDSVEQFPEWQPHLTLGYPATPAKKDDAEYRLGWVSFDRIAIWTGDFEGPEFRLQWPERVYDEAGWSATVQNGSQAVATLLKHAETVSDTAWSNFADSDFDDDQWKSSCILDRGEDYTTAKQRYAIPVREPNGTVNRKAVSRAAAILSSKGGFGYARGNKINATHEQLVVARTKLISLYTNTLEEDVPEGLTHSADLGADFVLEHYGVKGMRWGVRKEEDSGGGNGAAARSPTKEKATRAAKAVGRGASGAARFVGDVAFESEGVRKEAESQIVDKAATAFSRTDLPKIKAKPEYQDARKLPHRLLHPSDPATKAYRKEIKDVYAKRLEEAANSMTNASGNRQYTIRERGWELPAEGGDIPRHGFWEVTSREIKHVAANAFTLVRVDLDEDGFVDKIKRVADTVAQSVGMDEDFLAHYGVKGMRWGVRKEDQPAEQNRGMFDPEGHDKTTDIFKAVVWPLVPPLGLFAIPADVRLARAAGRGVKAKAVDVNEKRFAAKAQTAKNFAKIHNAAGPRIDREIPKLNAKHPGDIKSDPKKQKAYDDDVVKMLQGAYRESANSMGNRAGTMHLDLEFKNDGMDFAIKAQPGKATPLTRPVQTERVRHAAEDDVDGSLDITGKVLRDDTGHFRGLEFDLPGDPSMAQTADLGADFVLEHYGVKGMHWGVRKDRSAPTAVAPTATSVVPHGTRRKTKITREGGENHPAHEDAIKVAQARAKLSKSGPAALSNAELRDVANRLQLEGQVKQLTQGKGQKFVTNLVKQQGQQEIGAQFNVNRQNRLRPKTA
jgi:2'-5' RNA ligase